MKSRVDVVRSLCLVLTTFLVTLISAQESSYEASKRIGEAFAGLGIGLFGPIFGALLGGVSGIFNAAGINAISGTKVLMGILLYMIIYSIVKQMSKADTRSAKFFAGIASVIIVILSFLYMPEDFVKSIALQYGAMGAAILIGVPFIILLYFSFWVTDSLVVARVIWVFYVIYYFTLFVYAAVNITDSGYLYTNLLPYLAAILAGIIIFFLLPAFRKWIFKGELSGFKESGEATAERAKLLHKLQRKELSESYGAGAGI